MELLTTFIYDYGIIAIFFIILLEYACFPISSEIVLPLSGAIASSKHTPFYIILIISIIAGLLGTGFCFFLGYFGGNKILEYIIAKFPKSQKGIIKSKERFNKYGTYAVCFGRIIPICRTYIAFIAGVAKQNIFKFFIASSIGISIWNTLLIGIGFLLKENWNSVSIYYNRYKLLIIPTLITIAFTIIILKIKKKF